MRRREGMIKKIRDVIIKHPSCASSSRSLLRDTVAPSSRLLCTLSVLQSGLTGSDQEESGAAESN